MHNIFYILYILYNNWSCFGISLPLNRNSVLKNKQIHKSWSFPLNRFRFNFRFSEQIIYPLNGKIWYNIRNISYVNNKRNVMLRRKRNLKLLPLVRCFIIALNNNQFNLNKKDFRNYIQVISFLRNYDYYLIEDLKIDKKFLNNLAKYKSISYMERIFKDDWNATHQDFCSYVKEIFPEFNLDKFTDNVINDDCNLLLNLVLVLIVIISYLFYLDNLMDGENNFINYNNDDDESDSIIIYKDTGKYDKVTDESNNIGEKSNSISLPNDVKEDDDFDSKNTLWLNDTRSDTWSDTWSDDRNEEEEELCGSSSGEVDSSGEIDSLFINLFNWVNWVKDKFYSVYVNEDVNKKDNKDNKDNKVIYEEASESDELRMNYESLFSWKNTENTESNTESNTEGNTDSNDKSNIEFSDDTSDSVSSELSNLSTETLKPLNFGEKMVENVVEKTDNRDWMEDVDSFNLDSLFKESETETDTDTDSETYSVTESNGREFEVSNGRESGVSKIETSRLCVRVTDSGALTPDTPDTLDGVIGFYGNSKEVDIYKESDKESDKDSDNSSVVTVTEFNNNSNNNSNSSSNFVNKSTSSTIKNINCKRYYSSKAFNDNTIINSVTELEFITDTDTSTSSNANANATAVVPSVVADISAVVVANNTNDVNNTNEVKNTDVRDNIKVVKSLPIKSIQKIEFLKDNCSNVEGSGDIFIEIENTLNTLKGINNKGYINDTNLLNYPLLDECIINGMYVKDKRRVLEANAKNVFDNSVSDKVKTGSVSEKANSTSDKEFKVNLGDDVISVETAKDLFKWSYNLVILNLLKITEEMIFKMKIDWGINEGQADLYTDYINMSKELLHKLDPSIRTKLSKRGISISHNIYTGFDTEYSNINSVSNKLLSIQLSVSSRTLVQFPFVKEFDYNEIEILTGKEYAKFGDKYTTIENIDWFWIKNYINSTISYIRFLKYANYDDSLDNLVIGLRDDKYKYVEKDNSIVFVFDRSPIKQYFKVCDSFRLVDVVNISYNLVEKNFSEDRKNIGDILEKISKRVDLELSKNKNSNKTENEDAENICCDDIDLQGDVDTKSSGFDNDENGENDRESKIISNNLVGYKDEKSENIDDIDLELEKMYKNEEMDLDESYKEEGRKSVDLDAIKNGVILMIDKVVDVSGDNSINYTIDSTTSNGNGNKKYVRTNHSSYVKGKVNVTRTVNNFLMCHYSPADLSMLSDFDLYKHQMDIVNKCFVTLRKPILINGINVYIRDTKLIAPSGKKSLEAISSLYDSDGNFNKKELSLYEKQNMDILLREKPELFKDYALHDSLITLVHGMFMEDFNHSINGLGVPLTLSALSSNYIRKYWIDTGYRGYQISPKYLLTDVSNTITPKGLSVVKELGLKLPMYISSYRGGRNESYMYGYEKDIMWYDYDLVSAYTTAMLLLGTPDYQHGRSLTSEEFWKLKWTDKIYSYTVLSVEFEYPKTVKYPCIPCNIDEDTTVYPLKGKTVITSLEYLVAKKQNAKIKIKDAYYIPFKMVSDGERLVIEKPFYGCIKEMQINRKKYPKGTIANLLIKELINSEYGIIVQGISKKMKFNARTNDMKRMEGTDLSNPLIAAWITSFVRCVIGESLHAIQLLGGKVVSATTDGFITDIKDFESKIIKHPLFKWSLFNEYRKEHKEILEQKHAGRGVLSWSTRGQVSAGSKILAATGFQKGGYSLEEVEKLFMETMLGDKELTFIQRQLRSGKDIFKFGGNVTEVLTDKVYRIMYDNKRVIIDKEGETLLDSRPLNNIDEGSFLRYISKLPKTNLYTKNMSNSTSGKYKNVLDLTVRNFIRALMHDKLNLDSSEFNSYKEIVSYIKCFDTNILINENIISQLKRRGNFSKVIRRSESEAFVGYIKNKFPKFNENEFFRPDQTIDDK